MSETRPAPPGPQPPPDLIAEATKRAGLVWIAIGGQPRPRPAWHVWRAAGGSQPAPPWLAPPGAAYVLTGPGEQPLPGLAGAGRVTVIVPGGQAGPSRVTWTAAVRRVAPGSAEWDEVIGQLVAGRLNAVLPPGQTSPAPRWARSGAVFQLAPIAGDHAGRDSGGELTGPAPTRPGPPVNPPLGRCVTTGGGRSGRGGSSLPRQDEDRSRIA